MKPIIVERELTTEGTRPLASGRSKRRTVSVNVAESPLGWLYARGHLNRRLYEAGERLRADYERAQLAPSITMRWDPVRIKGGAESGLSPTERQVAAKQRFDGAVDAAGSGLADILWRVVCAGETLPDAERALTWPVRSGKLVLRLALERVADFYRVPGE